LLYYTSHSFLTFIEPQHRFSSHTDTLLESNK